MIYFIEEVKGILECYIWPWLVKFEQSCGFSKSPTSKIAVFTCKSISRLKSDIFPWKFVHKHNLTSRIRKKYRIASISSWSLCSRKIWKKFSSQNFHFHFFRYEDTSCDKILFHYQKEHEKTIRMSGKLTFFNTYNTMKNASERVKTRMILQEVNLSHL